MWSFISGIIVGCFMTISVVFFSRANERAECAQEHNVYTCDLKSEWVPKRSN